MPRMLPTFLCMVLAVAFVQAPFTHTHDHSDPFNHGGPMHVHPVHSQDTDEDHGGLAELHSHDAEGPEAASIANNAPDHDAKARDLFTFTKDSAPFIFVFSAQATIFEPTGVSERITAVDPQAHDPPELRSVQSRAPPA